MAILARCSPHSTKKFQTAVINFFISPTPGDVGHTRVSKIQLPQLTLGACWPHNIPRCLGMSVLETGF